MISSESEKYKVAMNKLFTAKWNVPKASEFLEMEPNSESWEILKVEFRKYCLKRQISPQFTFTPENL